MKRTKRSTWAARAMWGIAVSFLAFDAIGKLLAPTPVIEATARLGYAPHSLLAIGILELACLTLYVIPPTAVFGAVVMTGYLGGAVATHVRIGDPLFSHVLFPIYVAVLLWGALVIRDARIAPLLAARRADASIKTTKLSAEVQP